MAITKKKSTTESIAPSIEDMYPYLAAWVADGWVEIGQDEFSSSFVRALDTGGMVFEGKTKYSSLDAALQDLNDGIKRWCTENKIDLGIDEG